MVMSKRKKERWSNGWKYKWNSPAHLNKSESDQLARPINLLEIQGTEKQVKWHQEDVNNKIHTVVNSTR